MQNGRVGWILGALALAVPAGAMEVEGERAKELVALVHDAGGLVAEQGPEAACEAFREDGSRWLEGDRYVFVLSGDGDAICHPTRPELEGRSLRELRDPKGKEIVAGFLREVGEDGEGWMHYLWPRPGHSVFTWKSTYVARTTAPDGAELVVGSGLYQLPMERAFVVEQVDDAVALLESEGEAAFEVLHDESSGFLFYDAYVFVLDQDGVLLVNDPFPGIEGRDLTELQDIDGRFFVREMLGVPVGDDAWVHYKWPRPGDERPSRKSSYVRAMPWPDGTGSDGKLIVGAGVYFEAEPPVRELGPASDVPDGS